MGWQGEAAMPPVLEKDYPIAEDAQLVWRDREVILEGYACEAFRLREAYLARLSPTARLSSCSGAG